jgi:hypothetical protein
METLSKRERERERERDRERDRDREGGREGKRLGTRDRHSTRGTHNSQFLPCWGS